MHSDKKRCADTLSLSRQAEQNRAEERVSIDTKKGSKYNKSNEKRGGGIQLKKRKWKFRIAGGAVTLLGIYLMAVGYGETITLTIATVVLIFGIAIWSMATPENYNSMTDMIAMISMEKPRKIEEFYEAYKNVDTPFGSAWLAKFYTMRQKALVFGPDAKGEYLYFWLTKDGHVGYLGYSFIEGFIKKKLTTPVYPIHEDVAENLADHLSYHSEHFPIFVAYRNAPVSVEHQLFVLTKRNICALKRFCKHVVTRFYQGRLVFGSLRSHSNNVYNILLGHIVGCSECSHYLGNRHRMTCYSAEVSIN